MTWATAFTWFWMIILWMGGIAIAKGFLMTILSIIVPPLAWVISLQWIIETIIIKI